MKVTVTATRAGLTAPQRFVARSLVGASAITVLIHGAARGGDSILHDIAGLMGVPRDIHPANDVPSNLSALDLTPADTVNDGAPALVRNRTMVDKGEVLWAFPRLYVEERRSGTWAAIRYARKVGKPIWLVWPDGRLETADGEA